MLGRPMFSIKSTIVFASNFRNFDLAIIAHFEVPESENQDFTDSFESVYVWMCYTHSSKTNNSWKIKLDILYLYHTRMPLGHRTNSLYTGMHKRIQKR